MNLSDPGSLNTSSRFVEDPAAARHSTAGYCHACDYAAPSANPRAENDAGAISTHTEPMRASTANPKPAGDELAAEQWAHLRRFYVKGDGQ